MKATQNWSIMPASGPDCTKYDHWYQKREAHIVLKLWDAVLWMILSACKIMLDGTIEDSMCEDILSYLCAKYF